MCVWVFSVELLIIIKSIYIYLSEKQTRRFEVRFPCYNKISKSKSHMHMKKWVHFEFPFFNFKYFQEKFV